jgi:ABC-type uncharacterized transport system involved in gliding motility auxiliary subunit
VKTQKSVFDWLVTALGAVSVLLLAGALAGTYFPQHMPFSVANGLRIAGWIGVGLYVLGIGWQSRAFLADLARNKKTQGGANTLVFSIAFLAVLGLLNYVGAKYHKRLDVTQNKQYSLSEQTQKILGGLKAETKVVMLVRPGDPQVQQMKELWQEYAYHSKQLKFETLDPDREPSKARAFATEFNTGPTLRYGQIFLTQGEKKVEVTGSTEQDFTAGLLKLTQDRQKVVYFLEGHGEQELFQAKQALGKQNYKAESLSLFGKKDIPEDAAVVVVAGPQSALMPQEVDVLKAYVERGGRVYAMLSDKRTGLEDWIQQLGVTVRNDLVVDPRANLNYDPAVPVTLRHPYHAITQGLQATAYPMTRSLKQADKMPEGVIASALIETSPEAWGETNLMSRQIGFDPGQDAKGPLTLAYALMIDRKAAPEATASTPASASAEAGAASAEKKQQTRMIVMGSAQFANDALFGSELSNGDLFLKSLNWLAEEDALVSIPAKDMAPKTIEMMGNQINAVFWTSVAGMPSLLILAGGVIWWRRRRA